MDNHFLRQQLRSPVTGHTACRRCTEDFVLFPLLPFLPSAKRHKFSAHCIVAASLVVGFSNQPKTKRTETCSCRRSTVLANQRWRWNQRRQQPCIFGAVCDFLLFFGQEASRYVCYSSRFRVCVLGQVSPATIALVLQTCSRTGLDFQLSSLSAFLLSVSEL